MNLRNEDHYSQSRSEIESIRSFIESSKFLLKNSEQANQKKYELPIPGQRLQVDVKYVPHKVEGRRAYAYVAIDECTRWRFVHVFHHLDGETTATFLHMLKEKMPFPIVCIQTDNGFECYQQAASSTKLDSSYAIMVREKRHRPSSYSTWG